MKAPPLAYSALVVDDSPHSRILLLRLLQRSGISQVELAVNGAEGIRRYKTSKPNMVFLDAIMPEMDGLTALKEIKQIDPEAIVVMTTSLSEKEKVMQFKDAGANYYLLKPFENDKFDQTLLKILALLSQRTKKE
jgi:two-component system, chemotaxis family, chemotaxis protein CheY